MLVTLPKSFGAAAMLKRRAAPRRRKMDSAEAFRLENEIRSALDAGDKDWLLRIADAMELLAGDPDADRLFGLAWEALNEMNVINYPE
jgi:hypothetical protein